MPLQGEYEPSIYGPAREQAELYERTGGAEGNTIKGYPVVVLTSIGAKSGRLRKNCVIRVERDGQYLVVGSKGGAPAHPGWVHNLRANPHVELQDGPDKRDYDARELSGEEREEWWKLANDVYPEYDEYQANTDRQIPIFLLTPRDS